MMKTISLYSITTLLILFIASYYTTVQDYITEIREFQEELNAEYSNPEKSPLLKKDLKKFKGHDFYPIDSAFRVKATFTRAVNAIPFQMKTTTSRLPVYEKYGEARFQLNEKSFTLTIYQNHGLRETEEYKNHLFLPYTDLTNGENTYGGGRFIDLQIPEGDSIVIDFNKSYNPFCAYNHNYSCPIPPQENDLQTKIEAGVKYNAH